MNDSILYVGIVGSRRRNTSDDSLLLEDYLCAYHLVNSERVMFVSGGCETGADNFAEAFARKYAIPIVIFYPDYKRWGRSATFKRNGQIAEKCNMLIALVAGDRKGGTEDTIRKTEKLGKSVTIL